MKILFICDINSIHSQKWIGHFIEKGHEVSIYSTTAFQDEFRGAKVYCRKAHTSGVKHNLDLRKKTKTGLNLSSFLGRPIEALFRIYRPLRILAMIPADARTVKRVIDGIEPEIIHSLRIPDEGFLGMLSKSKVPFVVSIWGNDLTYWARKLIFNSLTRKTLSRCDFLFSDCEKDIKVSRRYGYTDDKPFLVVPGAGGIFKDDLVEGQRSLLRRSEFFNEEQKISGRPVILSLRGFGSQGQEIDNVPLIKACKLLVERGLEFKLVITGKKGGFRYHRLVRLIEKYRIGNTVFLIDAFSHSDALKALQSADFSISVARHDGTPNSMLEAMTFGAIPLMSNIESIREWITDGENGYLFDPRNPLSIAGTLQRAFKGNGEHESMRMFNYKLISTKADYDKCMAEVDREFLKFLLK